MRTISMLALALAISAGCSSFARAQGIDRARLKEMLTRLDTNKDGVIEKDEVPEARMPAFERLLRLGDKNKNGRLDADEVKDLLSEAPPAGDAAEGPMRRLAAMDTNKDGKVSREEFKGPAQLFERLDVNHDGFITQEEARVGFRAGQPGGPPIGEPKSSVGFTPLTDLATGTYQGKQGGLYPGGRNRRPASHEEAGMKLARTIGPLDKTGNPSDSGKIVLLSIGMSNTTQEFSTFKPLADSDPVKNPKLVIVDGAQGAMAANVIVDTESPRGQQFWQTVDERLERAGVSRAQVQVAWVKQAIPGPTKNFPDDAIELQTMLERIARILKERFPNIKLAYYSSRIYAGYATTPLNPEPFAYQSGFSVKWLIEKQLDGAPELNYDPAKGAVKAPWLAWGPYLWADGIKPRGDGLTYAQTDLGPDGTHPAPNGAREKVAKMLLDFFKSDSTARVWFRADGQVKGVP